MSTDAIAEQRAKYYNATVARIIYGNPDLMRIQVRPDAPLRAHHPGQYTSLGLGNWEPRVEGCQPEPASATADLKLIRRAYSISCPILDDAGSLAPAAEQSGWLEFYIVLVRESNKETPPALTPRLFALKEGDRLHMVEKIGGHFTLAPVKPGDNVLFLSTGTGEAPHNYMLWDLLRRGHTGRILSACCVRFKRDLGYLATHTELMRRHANYIYLPLTTREADTVDQKVYIQDLITSGQMAERLGAPLDPAKTHVYLCGNPKMIGVPEKDKETGARTYPKTVGVVELLEKMGFAVDNPTAKVTGNIHFEEYW